MPQNPQQLQQQQQQQQHHHTVANGRENRGHGGGNNCNNNNIHCNFNTNTTMVGPPVGVALLAIILIALKRPCDSN